MDGMICTAIVCLAIVFALNAWLLAMDVRDKRREKRRERRERARQERWDRATRDVQKI